jgi:REP element-mobilizing transposase RayT
MSKQGLCEMSKQGLCEMSKQGLHPQRARSAKITQLTFSRRGGARRGAGRKPKGAVALVSHAKRPALEQRTPVLVTAKLAPGLPNLRRGAARALVWRALGAAKIRFDVRVIHFSLQSNHLHAIVEARDEHALGRAMKGLCVRIARALNRALKRAGRVFADRYHARTLRTPREVRYALAYTLSNARKHGVRVEGIDPCSSGAAFDGWRERGVRALAVLAYPSLAAPPVAAARSWLLRTGWRRHGLIGIADAPGGKVQR